MRVIYLLLATAMFYLSDVLFPIAGIELSLKNPCAIAIVLVGLFSFMITARLGRAIVLARHAAVQMLPYLVTLFCSFFVWVVLRKDITVIWNGMMFLVPQLVMICAAAATLYLFGSKGIWYCLAAMCLANFLRVLHVIREESLSAFLTEFYTLLNSLGTQTGPVMQRLEIHDLTFAFGPFLICLLYRLLTWQKPHRQLLWLLPALFFFLIGLKRIAVPAVFLGLLAALILRLLPGKGAAQTALCLAAGMMVISFLYLAAVKNGLFTYMENVLHLDTKGRMEMYDRIKDYYDISFTYIGHGLGFERSIDWRSGGGSLGIKDSSAIQTHNDFLRMYLNIGFWGYWLWLFSCLIVRTRYWFRQGQKDGGCLFFGICVYCFILYATDNTIYYPYTTIACSILPMASRLDQLADDVFYDRRNTDKHSPVPDRFSEKRTGGVRWL